MFSTPLKRFAGPIATLLMALFSITLHAHTWSVSSQSVTTEPLRGIWGTSASNIWVVGGSTNNAFILKWDGASWSSQTVPSQTGGRLSSIWGADANNLWACGNNGRIVRTTDGGANWTVVTSPISTRLSTIWGASSTDIWAAGDGGVIIHWNGASWSVVTSPTADNHRMLWGSGASDIWLVSDNAGTNGVMHYNGSTWSVYSQSITQRPCFSVWGLDTNNVWVGTNLNSTTKVPDILKWNGSSWSQSNTGLPANTLNNTRGFAGTSASNLWLCNDQSGFIAYWNGSTWAQDTSNTANSLQSIWISPAGDFLVSVGTGGVIVTLVPPSLADAPTVTTPTSASVTENSATLGGNVTADGGASITERGVVYALTTTNANPEIAGTGVVKVAGTGTTGVFTVSATSLVANSGYSFKAYATNSEGTSYSSVGTFSTLADMTAPTVVSVIRSAPSAQAISTSSVTFRVTYSEPVTGVAVGRFVVMPVGGSDIVGTVTGVTPVSTSVYDVAVTITSGTGEFRLRVQD